MTHDHTGLLLEVRELLNDNALEGDSGSERVLARFDAFLADVPDGLGEDAFLLINSFDGQEILSVAANLLHTATTEKSDE